MPLAVHIPKPDKYVVFVGTVIHLHIFWMVGYDAVVDVDDDEDNRAYNNPRSDHSKHEGC